MFCQMKQIKYSDEDGSDSLVIIHIVVIMWYLIVEWYHIYYFT